jgi:hypothetical protein
MKLAHRFAQLTPEKRPQDPHLNGKGLRWETMEHGGEYSDIMPPGDSESMPPVAPASAFRTRKMAKWLIARDICPRLGGRMNIPRYTIPVSMLMAWQKLRSIFHEMPGCRQWFDMHDLGQGLAHVHKADMKMGGGPSSREDGQTKPIGRRSLNRA